jgi:ZIP family zinc transporter
MWEAALWGFVGGFALIIGAAVGIVFRSAAKAIGIVMAFGSGVLISALAFELTEEAFHRGGGFPVVGGLAGGAVAFFLGDWIIDHRGGQHRKRSGGQQSAGSGGAIVLGSLLDGIPESVAIGISILGGGSVGVAVVAAVFLSNIPESLSAATGLRRAGHSTTWIMGLWGGIAVASAAAAAIGYLVLGGAPPEVIAVTQAFAAGAILTMLADTMMPEAFEHSGSVVGLATCLGFVCAFLLSQVG